MKRIKILSIASLGLFFFSCDMKPSHPKVINLSTNTIELHAGETYELNADQEVELSSDNDFIARIKYVGANIIEGRHIGTTVITASNTYAKAECTVTVIPKYNTYIEPYYEALVGKTFGDSEYLDQIKKFEKREFIGQEGMAVKFKGEKSHIKEIQYICQPLGNGKTWCKSAIVILDKIQRFTALKFLSERYPLFRYENNDIFEDREIHPGYIMQVDESSEESDYIGII